MKVGGWGVMRLGIQGGLRGQWGVKGGRGFRDVGIMMRNQRCWD